MAIPSETGKALPIPKFAPRSLANIPLPPQLTNPPAFDVGAFLASLVQHDAQGNAFIGPDINRLGDDPSTLFGKIGQSLSALGNTSLSSLPIPGAQQLGALTGTKVGDVGALFAPPTQAQSDNPLFALGPEGNFAGNIGEALAPAARIAANKAISGVEGLARPAQTAAAGLDRFVADVGKTRSLVKDTKTGETMPVIFGGPDHAAQAAADAARRNLPLAQEAAVKTRAAELVPPNSALRKLTSPQLLALRESGSNLGASEKAVIDAILGERAFTSGPAAQIAAAVRLISPDVATSVRRSLRTVAGKDLTPSELLGAPGFGAHIDNALAAVNADRNIPNRTALAQAIIDEQRKRNVFATVAAAKKSTGDPVIDQVQNKLSQIAEDAKGGLPTPQVVEETVDTLIAAVARPRQYGPNRIINERIAAIDAAIAAEPKQLSLESGPAESPLVGGGGPPSKVPPRTPAIMAPPPPPTRRAKDILIGVLKGIPELAQATRGIAAGDFSQAGSQTFPALFSHPLSYIKGNVRGFLDIFKTREAFRTEQLRYQRLVEREGISAGPDGLYLGQVGGNITLGEEKVAGLGKIRESVDWIGERIPAIRRLTDSISGYYEHTEQGFVGAINAVRTYSFVGAVRGLEWMYGRGLTPTEKVGIAHDINLMSGRGFNFPKPGQYSDTVIAVAKLANGLGFGPQLRVSRIRLAAGTPVRMTRIAWDIAHGHAPRPEDIEFLHVAAGYAASITSMWAIAAAAGLKIGWHPEATDFGKIELGEPSPDMGKAIAAAELLGFRSQTYNGKVYIEPTQGLGTDIRLIYRLINNRAVDSKGKAWQPWDPKFGQDSAWDLVVKYFQGKLLPAYASTVEAAQGNAHYDLGDPTQNPVTGFTLPLWMQSGLQASGETNPGGSLYINPLSTISVSDAEKQRLNLESPDIPELNSLSPDRQFQYLDRQKQVRDAAISKLLSSPEYQAASDTDKRDLYSKTSDQAAAVGRKAFGLDLALNGAPSESNIGTVLAFVATPANYDRAALLHQIDSAGKLTPEATAAIDAKRKQTNPKQLYYDMSVADYLHGYALRAAWDKAPHFISGTPTQWEAAERAADQYKKLIRGMTADQRNADRAVDRFYNTQAGGWLQELFDASGSRRMKYVSPQRIAIEQDQLWDRFAP